MSYRNGSLAGARLAGALVILTAGLTLQAQAATLPTAPQTFDTTYTAPSGNIINVAAGGDLQGALNNAQLGDTIVLQAGASYTGPFTLPNKTTGTGWIYITSSQYSSLPGPGTRVSPNNAAAMPKILSPANSNAIVTVANSHHFRFVGIEIAPVPGAFTYNVVTVGNLDKSTATLAHHIVFDRCYIHGDPVNLNNRRGVEMDGAYVAVIDSYVSGFQQVGYDTQALAAWNTSGPIKVVDNYLEAAGENIIFGGADSAAASLVPADIEIRNNYFYKPLSLMGSKYVVKNLLEFKSAQRALVVGNVFQNNWAAAQQGFSLLVTPRNQNNTAPWSITTDIAVTGNAFINLGSGINILGTDNLSTSGKTARVAVVNNVIGVTALNGASGRAFQIICGGSDITIDHNTIFNSSPAQAPSDIMASGGAACPAGSTVTTNFVFTNNLSTPTTYGFFGSGVGTGNPALKANFGEWTFTDNVMVGEKAAQYPPNNFFPASLAAVGFTAYTGGTYMGGDYTLSAKSPYKNAGTDGLDLGANLDASSLAGNAANAIIPNPPSNLSVK
jgi:hypothetical protein